MKHKRKLRRICAAIFIIILLTIIAFYDSASRIVTTEYEVAFENLPNSFDGYRIVQISDAHGAYFGTENETLISAVRSAEPDIIVITGDVIDSGDSPEYAAELGSALADIAPVYYVTGNHEWDSGHIQQMFDLLDETDVVTLRNEYVLLEQNGESIVLAGADDPNGYADMKTPEELMSEVTDEQGEDAFTVMLYHRNDRFERYAGIGCDLIICGHAHGGVVRLPFTDGLVGPQREILPTYTSGEYYIDSSCMVVSRGLGTHGMMLRLFNNPHIPVIVLRAE